MIILRKATLADCQEIYDLQVISFKSLLDKYQDMDSNPGAEKVEYIMEQFQKPFIDFYLICLDEKHIGAMMIAHFEKTGIMNRICILPEYQEKGYAQEAMRIAESFYPDVEKWKLETILQEKKLCHLYEKMGYQRTDENLHIKEGMDIISYEKSVLNEA